MIAASRFLDRPIDDALRRLADLALCNVEIVHDARLLGRAPRWFARPCTSRVARCEPSGFRRLYRRIVEITLVENTAYDACPAEAPSSESHPPRPAVVIRGYLASIMRICIVCTSLSWSGPFLLHL